MGSPDRPTRIITVGEILVEIMSTQLGSGFTEPQSLIGPYPSGAPAIFIDQVAQLGAPCAIIGTVGDDDFGHMNVARLQADGVDTSMIAMHSCKPTGIAFVRYRPDGDRDFVFTLNTSAASEIPITKLPQQLEEATHLHVVGSSMSMPAVAEYVLAAIPVIQSQGGTVSFDPNIRPTLMRDPQLATNLRKVLNSCDLFLPSEGELLLFSQDDYGSLPAEDNTDKAIQEFLGRGVPEIVLKRGRNGASRYTQHSEFHCAGFKVEECDPTGAGDSFDGAYIALRALNHDPESALLRSCAAGAIAVTRQGPMEGIATLSKIEKLVSDHSKKRNTLDG